MAGSGNLLASFTEHSSGIRTAIYVLVSLVAFAAWKVISVVHRFLNA
jgi:hypothetical protein